MIIDSEGSIIFTGCLTEPALPSVLVGHVFIIRRGYVAVLNL